MAEEYMSVYVAIRSKLAEELLRASLHGLQSESFRVIDDGESLPSGGDPCVVICDWRELLLEKKAPLPDGQHGGPVNITYVVINLQSGGEAKLGDILDVKQIRGLFYEDDGLAVFSKGIEAVTRGDVWVPREVLLAWMTARDKPANGSAYSSLSTREIAVLRLIAAGKSNKEISSELFISVNTVKAHLYNIYRKIDVANRLHAAIWASSHFSGKE